MNHNKPLVQFLFPVFAGLLFFTATHTASSQDLSPHRQADLLLLEGNYAEAAARCREILAADSSDAEAWARLGMALEEMVRYTEAAEAYNHALEADSLNLQYLALAGRNFSSLGHYAEAVKRYEKIRSLNPADLNARNQLIRLYQVVGRCDSALVLSRDFLKTDSLNFWYHKQEGNCLQRMNQDSLAAGAYMKALELNPYDFSLYPTLGNLLLRMRKWDRVIDWSERALALDSTLTTMVKLEAYANLLKNQPDSAIRQFHRALALGDTSLFTLKYLGLAYYQDNLPTEAIPFLQGAFEQDSLDPEIAFHLGVSLGRSLYKEEAIPMLEYSYRLIQPDSGLVSDIYKELAYNHYFFGNYDKVLDYYQQAYTYTPDQAKILFEIAYTWDYALNNKKKALEAYQQFLDAIAYVHREEEENTENPGTISMGSMAWGRIKKLKEELHFEGEKF